MLAMGALPASCVSVKHPGSTRTREAVHPYISLWNGRNFFSLAKKMNPADKNLTAWIRSARIDISENRYTFTQFILQNNKKINGSQSWHWMTVLRFFPFSG